MGEKKPSLASSKRKYLLVLPLLGISVFLVLELSGKTNFFLRQDNQANLSEEDKSAQTTSSQPTADANYSEGNVRDEGNSLHEGEGTAVITDTNGVPSSDTSNPSVSASKEITVYLPAKDSLISSGQEVSGKSSLPVVQYRILDNDTGLIATGTLKVVNGNFSGKLSFETGSQDGRIDVFATRADGTEYSNVEIPVRFK